MSATTTATATAPQLYSLEGARDNRFYIPSVNIGPFLQNPSSSEANAIVDQVRAACQSTGFFQITSHGISKSLQEEVFAAGRGSSSFRTKRN
jgi:isopenicillin N synthase-like dioxygenase